MSSFYICLVNSLKQNFLTSIPYWNCMATSTGSDLVGLGSADAEERLHRPGSRQRPRVYTAFTTPSLT